MVESKSVSRRASVSLNEENASGLRNFLAKYKFKPQNSGDPDADHVQIAPAASVETKLCIHRQTGAVKQVKIFSKAHLDKEERAIVETEIAKIMQIVSVFASPTLFQDHPNIERAVEFFDEGSRYYLITE